MLQRGLENIQPSKQQREKDKIALENTKKIHEERKKLRLKMNSWVPKSINDENAIFSKKVPHKKVYSS